MRNPSMLLTALLVLYLIASLVGSAIVTLCDDPMITGQIIRNRCGLLLMELCLEDNLFVLWSPFNNACDVFLLVVDWSEGLRIASDGFYYFGHW